MKLLELEIEQVRGIRHLVLKPEGRNIVVWGPNGSGKSAVVDAVDFLLTGRILRLTGEGTGCLSLSKHGPHIDCKAEESAVRGVIQLHGTGKPVELKRSMVEPKKLYCSSPNAQELDRIVALAEQGLHVLSRREILKYIWAESSTRAQEIQELLNITEVEETRKSLVKVRNEMLNNPECAHGAVARYRSRAISITGDQHYEDARVLALVNQNRSILGASAVTELHSEYIKKDVGAPRVPSQAEGLNATLLGRDVQNLRSTKSAESETRIGQADERLRELIAQIHANPELTRTLNRIRLIKLGITMIDGSGNCPLCDKAWPPGQLVDYLKKRIETASVASKYMEEIGTMVEVLLTSANRTIASLQKVIAASQAMGLEHVLRVLRAWLADIDRLAASLASPVERYLENGFPASGVKIMLAPVSSPEVLADIEKAIREKYPETTPEQTAWDTLTLLKGSLASIETAQLDEKTAQLSLKRAALLHDRFLYARDRVLGGLYEKIKDRFVDIYRELHSDDEKTFSASIEPEEAGLNFTVDFYGRGAHPPHALHSEGHQDSMGLCLFLALAEHLTTGLVDLIVLDDVVMSVDAGHRRRLCHLLAKHFPDRQFLITTHDRTWANQLKAEGVVDSHGSIEFYNWSLELGPQVNCQADLWDQIRKDIESNDVPGAAHKLRRGCEEYFAQVCDVLRARVRYRLDGRWELGDLLGPAIGQYWDLLKKAKSAAQSWEDKEAFERLQELDSTVGQIYARCQVEQ
jgi:recombinational DNA repair ATPase RecF